VKRPTMGIPNPRPLSQTAKLRLSAAEKSGFPLGPTRLILRSHLPGVVPQELKRDDSAKIQTKRISIDKNMLDDSKTDGTKIAKKIPKTSEKARISIYRAQ